MSEQAHAGGCQCGAVRFRVSHLGRATLCHCRMCQKATAGIGTLLVLAGSLEWTRGTPKYFVSSNIARRGFCGNCGTPLTYESDSGMDISIVALDEPERVSPHVQLAPEARLPWADGLPELPGIRPDELASAAERAAKITSYQHPDHDTTEWKAGT
jgi:hypothetical protein